MFSGLRSPASQSQSQSQDADPFKSILSTQAQRQEFTLLILLCSNHMRTSLTSAFSVSHTSARPSIQVRSRSDDPEGLPPSYNDATKGRGRQDYDRRDEELASFETQEIRKHAQSAMNAWRTKVLRRVSEVLNVRSETILAEKARREALSGDDQDSNSGHRSYATISTNLSKLEREHRETLLSSLLLLLLSLETYSAYSRVLLGHVCNSLELPQSVLSTHESTTAKGLLKAAENMTAEKETAAAANSNAAGRAWKVGLATVAGAALIGVTGGLAAPFLAAGVGGIFGAIGLGGTAAAGLLGGLAGNVVLIGGLFGAYGGRMTGGLVDKYAAEISDFAFLPIQRQDRDSQHHLRVGIAISGWLTSEAEVTMPWTVLSPSGMETFALRWELSLLLELGTSLAAIAKSYVWGYAKAEILKRTLLSTLAAGLWPLGLVRIARIAENPFSIALVRADKAGELLADALINHAQGERPVNLIGYSLGARVIYSCLQSLARRKAFGLIENAVLIGAPCPSDAADWRRIRAVCVGRVVNVYSTNDFILAFLYRASSIQYGVAGVEAIEEVSGVESWDVSVWVSGHTRYRHLVGRVLKEIGFEGLDGAEVHNEAERLRALDEREAQEKADDKSKKLWSGSKQKRAEENLIDFDDDNDAKESAHQLSDQDIQRQIQHMSINEKPSQVESLLDGDLQDPPAPQLPPRRRELDENQRSKQTSSSAHFSSETVHSETDHDLEELGPEPIPLSDDETLIIQERHKHKQQPERCDETDEDDDPCAGHGIRMVDAEDEEAAEREARRIERSVQKELSGIHRGKRQA